MRARVVGPGEERYGKLIVVRHVQLEKARTFTVRFSYILDRLASSGG